MHRWALWSPRHIGLKRESFLHKIFQIIWKIINQVQERKSITAIDI